MAKNLYFFTSSFPFGKGESFIDGQSCSKQSDLIQNNLGYLPGEIAFMDDMTGINFIKFAAKV